MASPEEPTSIVQLKIRLLGISPMIWRRVLVPVSVCVSCTASCKGSTKIRGVKQQSLPLADPCF